MKDLGLKEIEFGGENPKTKKEEQMRKSKRLTRIVLMLAALMLLVPVSAFAVGTAANTTVNNTADMNYSVGGGATITISNTVGFTVDRKVNFAVTTLGSATTSPGLDDVVLSFFVNNAGNDTQGFILDIYSDGGDTLDMNDVRLYLDDGSVANAFDGTDTLYTAGSGNLAFDLAADVGNRVIIVANTPIGADDGNIANYSLIARATGAGTNTLVVNTAGANNAGLDTVIADGANGFSDSGGTVDVTYNNAYSSQATYTVSSAIVTFSKLFNSVVWDPVNYNNGNQKAIPGAIVQYELTIENDAGAAASAIIANIEDSLPASLVLTTYKDDLSTPSTPVSSSGNEFYVFCTLNAGTRACDVADTEYDSPDSNSGGVYLLNLLTSLPNEDIFLPGEIKPGDIIRIRYMAIIQ